MGVAKVERFEGVGGIETVWRDWGNVRKGVKRKWVVSRGRAERMFHTAFGDYYGMRIGRVRLWRR